MNDENMNEAILLLENLVEWIEKQGHPNCNCTPCAARRFIVKMTMPEDSPKKGTE